MILEVAQIRIKTGQTAEFEAAYRQAQQHLSAAEGYLSHELRRCVEQPDQYLLLVHWRRLEDHTVGFRASRLFQDWRRLIGSFFDSPPSVVHYQSLDNQAGAGASPKAT
jgi:heme-degrading monooxygenase HmoA